MVAKLPRVEPGLGVSAMARPLQPANDGQAFLRPPPGERQPRLCPPFSGALKRTDEIVPTTRRIARLREAQR